MQDEVKQEESEHNEVDGMKKEADSTGAYLKERLVICNDEDTDGRARVTTDEERVLFYSMRSLYTYLQGFLDPHELSIFDIFLINL